MSKIGQLLLRFYYTPLGRMSALLRQGGPWNVRKTERGQAEMEVAASHFMPLALPPAPVGHVVHLLTGARFWYQTVFCLRSLAIHTGCAISAEIYDDGTLTDEHYTILSRIGLPLRIHAHIELRNRLEYHLPQTRYPFLHNRWINYPNIRKLIDVHLASSGWKLVLDSDLLFFRHPTKLLHWLESPDCPLHAIDCAESYGYSRALMERLAGHPIPALVNVGLCGLRSEAIDWDRIEAWCRELITREKTHYFLEQALVAMLIAGRKYTVAPAKDYVTGPQGREATACTAVMHHYVADSKRAYFRHNWRRFCAS
jgi:hypothetical protein